MNGAEIAPDLVTRQELLDAVDAQEATLLAAGQERKILGRLRVRLERGAVLEPCDYYFDARLGIVRRRPAAAARPPRPRKEA